MSHPRIEEVSDSDDASDPSEGDIEDFAESDILRRVTPSSAKPPGPSSPGPSFPGTHQGPVSPQDIANYQCLYPLYFDASRTRSEGRRVPANLAVKNPLAREIANACAALRIQPVFEAHKTHPNDWANPGRVRVNLHDASNAYAKSIKNKHQLYVLVAKHLMQHPTTEHSDTLRRVQMPGLPMPKAGELWPKPAVPRGWKMNELVPAYSAAMTGGGVSENALRDMMKEMGAGGPGGMGGMGDMMSMLSGAAGPSGSGGGGGGEPSGGKKSKKGGKGKA